MAENAKKAERFVRFPLNVLQRAGALGLKPKEVAVLACLLSFRRGTAEKVWPKQETIGKMLGRSRQWVSGVMAGLLGDGYLVKERRRRASTIWHLAPLLEKAAQDVTPVRTSKRNSRCQVGAGQDVSPVVTGSRCTTPEVDARSSSNVLKEIITSSGVQTEPDGKGAAAGVSLFEPGKPEPDNGYVNPFPAISPEHETVTPLLRLFRERRPNGSMVLKVGQRDRLGRLLRRHTAQDLVERLGLLLETRDGESLSYYVTAIYETQGAEDQARMPCFVCEMNGKAGVHLRSIIPRPGGFIASCPVCGPVWVARWRCEGCESARMAWGRGTECHERAKCGVCGTVKVLGG